MNHPKLSPQHTTHRGGFFMSAIERKIHAAIFETSNRYLEGASVHVLAKGHRKKELQTKEKLQKARSKVRKLDSEL